MNDFKFILTSYDDSDDFKENDEIQLFGEDKNEAIVTSNLFNAAVDIAKKKLKG